MTAPRERCEVCGGAGRPWARRQGRDLWRCPGCGFMWVPEGLARTAAGLSIYEDEARGLFDELADYYHDEGALEAARDKLEWVSAWAPAGGRLLDVGANFGQFVGVARERFDALGIELSEAAVRAGRAQLGDALRVGSIDDDTPEFAGRFDVVTMFDVIEHLPDPAAALRTCHRYLAPGGHLFLTTPDSGSLVARLLGRRWYHLDLEQHISIFSTTTLTRLLAASGLQTVGVRTFGRRYRFSYIDRRLRELSRESVLMRVVRAGAVPLRLKPDWRVSINAGDVTGVVSTRGQTPLRVDSTP